MKNIFLLIVVGLLVVQVRSDLGWDGNQCYYYYWWDCYYDGSYACTSGDDYCYDSCIEYSWGWDWGSDNSGRYPVYVRWCGWAKYSWHMCHARCANCSGGAYTQCSRCNSGFYLGIFSGQTSTCYSPGACPTGSVDLPGQIVCTACYYPCYQCMGTITNCSACTAPYYRDYWTNWCYQSGNYCPNGTSSTRGQVITSGSRICQLCDPMCATCSIPNNAAWCTMCTNTYFLWQQSQHTCSPACRNGSDALGLYGQFEGGSNQCVQCNSTCRSCNTTSTNCFTCMAGSYLVDDSATCNTRWKSGNCTISCTAACEGDNICRPTQCPLDYYFEVEQANVATLLGYKYPAGDDRRNTSLCQLCDYRCRRCTGPSNLNCTACTDYFFKSANQTTCTADCPGGQYKGLQNTSLTAIQKVTECRFCANNCILCSRISTNCSQCVYPYTHANASYLYKTSQTDSECRGSCPASTSPLTNIGYYGSVKIMTCLLCPSPCSNCDLSIYLNNPAIDCTDTSCSNVLLCTTCLTGYTLVQGHCLSNSQCRQYAKYVPTPGSTQWAPSGCTCLQGYYISSYVKCSLCDYSCMTCRAAAANECTACPYDSYMTYQNTTNTSGTCTQNTNTQTLGSYTGNSAPTGVFSTPTKTFRNICGSNYLFGFNNTASDATNYLQFSTAPLGTLAQHWAINFRFKMIFIDEWPSSASVYIQDTTGVTYYSWVYNVYGAVGEQLCGDNTYDYVLQFFATWNHTDTGTSTYRIRTNDNLIGTNNQWGIRQVVVTISTCHSACTTCTGPKSTDCSSCATANMVSVNGTCVCDSANGWYWQSTACVKPCQTSPQLYGDPLTYTCVQPTSCSFPNTFGSPSGLCVQYCPNVSGTAYYAYAGTMVCVTDCYTTYGQYKFNGANNSCYAVCPNNYVAALTGECLTKCPTSSYRLIENNATNPKCSLTCTTGYKFDGDNTCVSICPVGYFISSGACVKTCPAGKYGDVVNNSGTLNGSCVTNCSNNYYADQTSHLCLKNCPSGKFEQLNSDFRSCETGCVSGQYANPLNYTCLSDPRQCPDGYYGNPNNNQCVTSPNCPAGWVADNTTKTCRTSCNSPGYAYWAGKMCVAVCPTQPKLFGDVTSGRQCIASCDSINTHLFGDAQNSRTCQPTCTATPVSTFGDYSTNECTTLCASTTYGDDLGGRLCRLNCTAPKFSDSVSRLCLSSCPEGYYGDPYSVAGKRICATSCPTSYFGDPTDNMCKAPCTAGLFGDPTTGLCVLKCPNLYFGANATTNRICVQTCDSGYWADNATRLCSNNKYGCTNGTFADATKRLCVAPTNCTTYADPLTNGCEAVCTGSTYFAEPYSHTCVTLCPDLNNLYSDGRICTPTCSGSNFMDYQQSRSCVPSCSRTPLALYSNPNTKYCVLPAGCPTSPAQYFANNNTLSCVATCSGSLPYGDPTNLQCVLTCPKAYYGQIQTNMCVQNCSNTYSLYADNTTGLCTTRCTDGTYGVSSATSPKCELNCPSGTYARATDNICVSDCGAGLYGDPITRKCSSDPRDCSDGYYANSVSHKCQLPANCQTVTTHYFAQNSTKTCVQQCLSPNYGDSSIYVCIAVCNSTSFGQSDSRLCLSNCLSSPTTTYADSQLSLCVAICSATNISTYGDQTNRRCVQPINCPTSPAVTYAMTNTARLCVQFCPTTTPYYFAYAVNKTCVTTCPGIYFGDRSSGVGLCQSTCPGTNRFADNYTKECQTVCPSSQSTFGDSTTKTCVLICSSGLFAQSDADRLCVPVCAQGTWGNPVTRVCITDPKNQCPSGTWGDNNTHLCTSQCSDSPQMLYGNNGTGLCDTVCPSPSFAYQITKVCIDVCPASLTDSGYFGDAWTTPRKCYPACQTASTYRDIYNSRTCQTTCTFTSTIKTYADPTTRSCQAVCSNYPQVLYADDTTKTCATSCSGGYYRDASTQSCASSCTLLNPSNNTCVQKCPTDGADLLYASNLSPNTCVIAAQCPTGTYGSFDTLECLSTCPTNQYKNSGTQTCVSICPSGTYKNLASMSCVAPISCPTDYFADDTTLTCVETCVGSFGDSSSHTCVNTCPSGKFADPVTSLCSASCTNTTAIVLQANTVNRTCESTCTVGLYANPTNNSCDALCLDPYYADDNSKSCVETCPSNPASFSDIVSNVRKCVTVCSAGKYSSSLTRSCVSNCPAGTLNYTLNQSCVTKCPEPYYANGVTCVSNCSSFSKFSDDTTRTCTLTCPIGYFSDATTAKCVVNCPVSPSYYAFENSTTRQCMTGCPLTYYADDSSRKCVQTCPVSPLMYRETVTRKCVAVCPLTGNYYGDATTGSCTTTCSSGLYADNRTRTCVSSCGLYLFKDSLTTPPSCVQLCSLTTYSNPNTMTCVSTCDMPYLKFGTTTNRDCVLFCPFGYFADLASSTCVQQCPAATPYADPTTRKCVSVCPASTNLFGYLATGQTQNGQCVVTCPAGFFSLNSSRLCVTQCPSTMFGDSTNNTCVSNCNGGLFADGTARMCAATCTSPLYANPVNMTCVSSCNSSEFRYADAFDTANRTCSRVCRGNLFAYDTTQTCVAVCPSTPASVFGDPYFKRCVATCYNNTYALSDSSRQCVATCPSTPTDLYADDATQACVLSTACSNGRFGESVSRKCVDFCPLANSSIGRVDTYANPDNRKCTSTCTSPRYANPVNRTCSTSCSSAPSLFAENSTRMCLAACLTGFADPTTQVCIDRCPLGYYADSNTKRCVLVCPEQPNPVFGNDNTSTCVSICPTTPDYFGSNLTRTCVLNCPTGTFADTITRQCVQICPSTTPGYFSENSTGRCLSTCLTGYADTITRKCIAVCSNGYYGQGTKCFATCPSISPTVYADDSSNLCVTLCPVGTYGSINKCVSVCPAGTYGHSATNTQICTNPCPSGYFGDASTRRCVAKCPMVPSTFGYQPQKLCYASCPFGTYADMNNNTRLCVAVTQCSVSLNLYADNTTYTCNTKCPQVPPMYGNPQTRICVLYCPTAYNLFADNVTRLCVNPCPGPTYGNTLTQTCVSLCPNGYYGINSTRMCSTGCPSGQFADRLIRICVQKCSVDPIYYGNRPSSECVTVCPGSSYGNPVSQQCVYDVAGTSTCPTDYFSDALSKLCVKICPMKAYTFAENTTKKCVSTCPTGSYADNSTMRCVAICPSMPNYFAHVSSTTCVALCPSGLFADPISRICVAQCPPNSWSENITRRCVTKCSVQPLGFADSTTWRCVAVCPAVPSMYYGSLNTLTCALQCLASENTYADSATNMCVRVCPPNSYGENITRQCQPACPTGTYADNSNWMCVSRCSDRPPTFSEPVSLKCVASCPINYTLQLYANEPTRQCLSVCPAIAGVLQFRQNSSRTCVYNCSLLDNSYAENSTGYCVLNCSAPNYADPITRRCVSMCPDQPLMYGENATRKCVAMCPTPTFGDNVTRTCVSSCPSNSLSLREIPQGGVMLTKNLCVYYCPDSTFAYYVTTFCLGQCPVPYYGDPSTRSCVLTCPLNQLLYADNKTRTCVKMCPDNSYGYDNTTECLLSCPVESLAMDQTYAADYNNKCVKQCANPTFAFIPDLKCLNSCPTRYYGNQSDHICYRCPTECVTCHSPTLCYSCINLYFLQDGQCVALCSVARYAKNSIMKCVMSNLCQPQFGNNVSRTCDTNCPVGTYGNTTYYRCEPCPTTCTSCMNLTYCTGCTTASLTANNYCFGYCADSTNRYYLQNGTCVSLCPDGTYLNLLNCLPCGSNCTTCFGSAGNCTRCSGGLYLQDGVRCVSQCDSGFLPNSSLICVDCGTCVNVLNFTSNTTQVNGKNVVFITYNNNVTVNGNLSDTMQLIPTSSRRLLDTSSGLAPIQVNNNTFMFILPDGANLSNYQYQILKPENVVDPSGNIPSFTRSTIAIPVTQTYTTDTTDTQGIINFALFISAVCWLTFLFDTEMMSIIQLLYLHYFIASTFPLTFSSILSAMKLSTLGWLPNILGPAVPEFVRYDYIPSKIIDLLSDYLFIRNGGYFFTVLAVLLLVVAIIKIMSVPEINRFKAVRMWCQQAIEDRWKFSLPIQVFNVVYLPVVFYFILNFKEYAYISNGIGIASAVVSWLSFVVFVGVTVLCTMRVVNFFKQYPKLSVNISKAADMILQENEYHLLHSQNMFLFDMKKIDLRNLLYPKINNVNILPFKCVYAFNLLSLLCPSVFYLRGLFIAIVLVAAQDSAILQLSLMIVVNLPVALYLIKARPYRFKYRRLRIRNYIAIFNEVVLIGFEIGLLVFALMDRDGASSTIKTTTMLAMSYYLLIVMLVNCFYFMFRIYIEVRRRVWQPFIETECFKLNFPELAEEYEQEKLIKKNKKLAKKLDPKQKEKISAILKSITKDRHSNTLRPGQSDKENPDLPQPTKITYFDRDKTSQSSSSTLSRKQRRDMIQKMFDEGTARPLGADFDSQWERLHNEVSEERPEELSDYEEYEEEVEIPAKDLEKYVNLHHDQKNLFNMK